ncbi:MAG: Uncharacterized protein G01um10145_31 [Microgenomates group bacterium Gr01-1014_5]|nr:MAG: Uncharacterized protein G01um10145_31 [Microgenomates group bacterium Gr01-1014_5]
MSKSVTLPGNRYQETLTSEYLFLHDLFLLYSSIIFIFRASITCDILGSVDQDRKSLRKKAILLRKDGLSYNEIKNKIGTSKSTLSYWLKNVPLSLEHKKRLYTRQIQILSIGPHSQRERRKIEIDKIINDASLEIKLPISLDSYRLAGAFLYWAEGSKKSTLQITNSDPYIILFMVKWLKEVFNIHPRNLKAWLNIYSQQNDIKNKKFWSELTGIPFENFGKSYIKPLNKGYKKNNLYYGTIKIAVPKSVNMKHRIFGWVKATLVDIESETRLIKQKWQRLSGIKRPINL